MFRASCTNSGSVAERSMVAVSSSTISLISVFGTASTSCAVVSICWREATTFDDRF